MGRGVWRWHPVCLERCLESRLTPVSARARVLCRIQVVRVSWMRWTVSRWSSKCLPVRQMPSRVCDSVSQIVRELVRVIIGRDSNTELSGLVTGL